MSNVHQVIFGLGSNCAPREEFLRRALHALEQDTMLGLESLIASQTYESAALLPEGAPSNWDQPFLNMVVCAFTHTTPEKLLIRAKAIEADLGRQRRGHWGPREIDIDILAVDDMVLEDKNLTLPHAQMLSRDFVMIPLAEILPNWRHPRMPEKSAAEIAEGFMPMTSLRSITGNMFHHKAA